MNRRRKLGEIFIEQGLITEKTLARVLDRSKRLGKKLGIVLEDMELVTGEELAAALASQYGCKVMSDFARFQFPKELFQLIPLDVATQHLLFPLKIENGRLALAMSDPTETKIVGNIAANNNLKVVPFIATRRDIIAAICRHYLGRDSSDTDQTTVLVVEDNKLISTMVSNVLQREGYRVVVAVDGMEAYRLALAERPQVIITDKELPKMDGYALLNALRNIPETAHIPMLLLTGNATGEEEARAFEKGFFDFMAKPVKEATLITRLKRALQSVENIGMLPR